MTVPEAVPFPPPPAQHCPILRKWVLPPPTQHCPILRKWVLPPPTQHCPILRKWVLPPPTQHCPILRKWVLPPPTQHCPRPSGKDLRVFCWVGQNWAANTFNNIERVYSRAIAFSNRRCSVPLESTLPNISAMYIWLIWPKLGGGGGYYYLEMTSAGTPETSLSSHRPSPIRMIGKQRGRWGLVRDVS